MMESGARTWLYAFNLLKRGLSSSAVETQKVKTKTKKKTLFEVVRFLPEWGIGYKVYKTHWDSNAYFKITRINLSQDGIHGKAWGFFHKNALGNERDSTMGEVEDEQDGTAKRTPLKGMPKTETPQSIGGANKRVWRYIDDLRIKTSETKHKSEVDV